MYRDVASEVQRIGVVPGKRRYCLQPPTVAEHKVILIDGFFVGIFQSTSEKNAAVEIL
jgi:hypothetical protein